MPVQVGSAQVTRVIVRKDASAAAATAAEICANLIVDRIRRTGVAHVGLAGGSTPAATYRLLGPLIGMWSRVHLWLGDERYVPADDPAANVGLIRRTLLVGAASSAVLHPVRTELEPQAACDAYEAELRTWIPAGVDDLPALDLVLLGIGEDGHTASLFAGVDRADDTHRAVVVVRDAPKPPATRISLTMRMLGAARERVVIATGSAKARAVAGALGASDPSVPASLLPRDATTFVLDDDAAALLERGDPDA